MIGINTYGLGMCLEKDFDGTLQQLKDAGIGAIDFAIRQDARYFIHSFNVSTIREIDERIPYIRDVARRLQEHGISLMMHNHEVEWVPDEGTTVFEHLLKEVPELTVELDEVTEFILDQDDSHGDMMWDVRVGITNIRKHII